MSGMPFAKKPILIVMFDDRPCGEGVSFENSAESICECGCVGSFHQLGPLTIALMRQPCDDCEGQHYDDCFMAPCLGVARECDMLCFVGSGAISPPPPLIDFAAAVKIPLCIISDIEQDYYSHTARWIKEPINNYRIRFRLTELRHLVATGATTTVKRSTLYEISEYWNLIEEVVEGDTALVNFAHAQPTPRFSTDDFDKLIKAIDSAGRSRLDEDEYLRQKHKLQHGTHTMSTCKDLCAREHNLIVNAIETDRMTPAEFIAMMSAYTFGQSPWSAEMFSIMDGFNAKNGIKKITAQQFGDGWRNNPVIDSLLKSRRYGLMVFASLLTISELASRDDICKYVTDTFCDWGRKDLVKNFEYLLSGRRTSAGPMLPHQGAGVLGHFMFTNAKVLSAAKVSEVMADIGLSMPAE